MEEKVENKSSISEEKKTSQVDAFSSSIKNAHASGDGSIKRSDEAIDLPKDEANDPRQEKNNY